MEIIATCPSCVRRNRLPASAAGAPACAACHTPLPWLAPATDADFERVAVDADLPVLVDLWAPWCGPCHAVAPHVERASQTFAGRLKVVKVNVDESPATQRRFGVRGIPTLLLLDHGREMSRQVGALGGDQLQRWLDSALAQLSARR